MKTVTINHDKCVGCRLCELACSLKNVGEFNPARARIQIIGFDELFSLPILCFQCETAFCAEVCPTGAITRDKTTGILRVSKQRCVGCRVCTQACPFGNIAFSPLEKVAIKCELCDGNPECVLFCPTGALEWKEADTAMIYKKRKLSEKLQGIYEGLK